MSTLLRYDDIGTINAVKLLPKIDSYNGYIQLYTYLDSHIEEGDTIFISYSGDTINLELETDVILDNFKYIIYSDNFIYDTIAQGYKVLYVNKSLNTFVIDRFIHTIPKKGKLYNHYVSSIICNNINISKGTIDGTVFRNAILTGNTSEIILTQCAMFAGDIENVDIIDKYSNNYISLSLQYNDINDTYIKYSNINNNNYGYSYFYDMNQSIINCNVYSGNFSNCNFISSSSQVIDGGYFNYCTMTNYEIYDGYFHNTNSLTNCVWHYGKWDGNTFTLDSWEDGVFINGVFGNDNRANWQNGTFLNGTWKGQNWYNGDFSGGVFNGQGYTESGQDVTTTWMNGNFKGGTLLNTNFNNIYWETGKIYGGEINNLSINSGDINGGKFYNVSIKNSNINGGYFYNSKNNSTGSTSTNNYLSKNKIYGGDFLGNWHNPLYTGSTVGLTEISDSEIFGGNFKYTAFYNFNEIHNGNFEDVQFYSPTTINNGKFIGGKTNLLYKDLRIEYWKSTISGNTSWYNDIIIKSISNNITINEQLELDSIWMWENSDLVVSATTYNTRDTNIIIPSKFSFSKATIRSKSLYVGNSTTIENKMYIEFENGHNFTNADTGTTVKLVGFNSQELYNKDVNIITFGYKDPSVPYYSPPPGVGWTFADIDPVGSNYIIVDEPYQNWYFGDSGMVSKTRYNNFTSELMIADTNIYDGVYNNTTFYGNINVYNGVYNNVIMRDGITWYDGIFNGNIFQSLSGQSENTWLDGKFNNGVFGENMTGFNENVILSIFTNQTIENVENIYSSGGPVSASTEEYKLTAIYPVILTKIPGSGGVVGGGVEFFPNIYNYTNNYIISDRIEIGGINNNMNKEVWTNFNGISDDNIIISPYDFVFKILCDTIENRLSLSHWLNNILTSGAYSNYLEIINPEILGDIDTKPWATFKDLYDMDYDFIGFTEENLNIYVTFRFNTIKDLFENSNPSEHNEYLNNFRNVWSIANTGYYTHPMPVLNGSGTNDYGNEDLDKVGKMIIKYEDYNNDIYFGNSKWIYGTCPPPWWYNFSTCSIDWNIMYTEMGIANPTLLEVGTDNNGIQIQNNGTNVDPYMIDLSILSNLYSTMYENFANSKFDIMKIKDVNDSSTNAIIPFTKKLTNWFYYYINKHKNNIGKNPQNNNTTYTNIRCDYSNPTTISFEGIDQSFIDSLDISKQVYITISGTSYRETITRPQSWDMPGSTWNSFINNAGNVQLLTVPVSDVTLSFISTGFYSVTKGIGSLYVNSNINNIINISQEPYLIYPGTGSQEFRVGGGGDSTNDAGDGTPPDPNEPPPTPDVYGYYTGVDLDGYPSTVRGDDGYLYIFLTGTTYYDSGTTTPPTTSATTSGWSTPNQAYPPYTSFHWEPGNYSQKTQNNINYDGWRRILKNFYGEDQIYQITDGYRVVLSEVYNYPRYEEFANPISYTSPPSYVQTGYKTFNNLLSAITFKYISNTTNNTVGMVDISINNRISYNNLSIFPPVEEYGMDDYGISMYNQNKMRKTNYIPIDSNPIFETDPNHLINDPTLNNIHSVYERYDTNMTTNSIGRRSDFSWKRNFSDIVLFNQYHLYKTNLLSHITVGFLDTNNSSYGYFMYNLFADFSNSIFTNLATYETILSSPQVKADGNTTTTDFEKWNRYTQTTTQNFNQKVAIQLVSRNLSSGENGYRDYWYGGQFYNGTFGGKWNGGDWGHAKWLGWNSLIIPSGASSYHSPSYYIGSVSIIENKNYVTNYDFLRQQKLYYDIAPWDNANKKNTETVNLPLRKKERKF